MNSEEMRAKLGELRTQAEDMLRQLGAAEAGNGADAWGLLNQFVSSVDVMIARSEESDAARANLKRFLDILPPESVRVEFERFKEILLDRFSAGEPIADIAAVYGLFIRLVEKPDLDLPQEEFDAVDDFFKRPLTRPLYQGKYSFAPAVTAKEVDGVLHVPQEGESRIPSGVIESGRNAVIEPSRNAVIEPSRSAVIEPCRNAVTELSRSEEESAVDAAVPEVTEDDVEEPSADTEASAASDNDISERQDESSPETAEPDAPNLREILPRFDISTPKADTNFSVKTFANDYFVKMRSGYNPKPNRKEELHLICRFSSMGALTKSQVKKYISTMGNVPIQKLCKDGYMSVVKHKESGVEFYALSAKGAAVFKKTSRDLMKIIKDPLPSHTWSYESELAQIDSDVDAYQCTATVALRFNKNGVVKNIERHHVDLKIPVILLRLETEEIIRYLAVAGVSKKVMLLPVSSGDFPGSRAEQEAYLRRVVRSACSDADGCKQNHCTVSDDHTVVNCFDSEGNAVDIDKYVESQLQRQSDTADQEIADLIERLAPEAGKSFDNKEFFKRLKRFAPKDDASNLFKEFVKILKRLSVASDDDAPGGVEEFAKEAQKRIQPKDEMFYVFKKFFEGLKQKQSTMEAAESGDEDPSSTDVTETAGAPAEAPHTNPFDMARQLSDKKDIKPSDGKEKFDALVSLILDAAADAPDDERTDYIGRAVVLRKTLALADKEKYDADYRRLLLATDMPLDDRAYSMNEMSTYFSGENEGTALHLAALLRALFRPASQDGYKLTDYAQELFKQYDRVFDDRYAGLKGMLGVFLEIPDESGGDGFTDEIIGRFIDENTKSLYVKGLSSNALELRNIPHINQRFNGIPEMLDTCFGPNSRLGLCMSHISENKKSDRKFVSDVYESFTDGGKESQQKIEEFIDESWKEVRHNSKKSIRIDDIVSTARHKIISEICKRLEIMNSWLSYAKSSSYGQDYKLSAMYSKTKKSLEASVELLRKEDASLPKHARAVLSRAVKNFLLRLSGKRYMSFLCTDWLSTGIFAVSDGIPVVNEDCEDIIYYERWRNALRHIAEEPARDLRDVLDKIETDGDPLYDNLGQAVTICEHLGIDGARYQKGVRNALESAENHGIREFEEKLDLDLAYGRICDHSKRTTVEALKRMKREFLVRSDFGELRRFLEALREGLNDEIAERRKYWESAVQERRSGGSPDKFELLDRAAEQLENGENAKFILVEETLNLFDGKADPSQCELDLNEEDFFDFFSEFIADKKYNTLEDLCKKNESYPLRSMAEKFVKDRVRENKESALRLLQSLPNSPEKNGADEIAVMLTEMGFAVSGVKRDNPGQDPAVFTVSVTPDRKNAESYKHPIAEMGTDMGDTLRVVELFGKMEPRSIIDAVPKSDSRRISLVLLNGYLTVAQRRQLAKLFLKDANAQEPFVLVDWILLLYIAQKRKEDRLRAMLACAMPYTGCRQLFSADGKTPIADEKYIGRTEEIRQIIDKNGPVFVYGGRQLGKTAMLLRARNVFHAPKNNDYSVYVDVKDCHDEKTLVAAIADEMRKIDADFVSAATAIKALCDEIREWLSESNNKRLLLLIDHSDDVLAALAEDNYAALNDIERLSKENKLFKFVFAGLHNILSAAKDINTVFGHHGEPICVRPLSQSDAYKMLAGPLRYLGFKTDPDTLLPLLVNTNFYPALIHVVGAELVETLIRGDLTYDKEFDNLPYRLKDKHIGSVIRRAGMLKTIEDRIRQTLEVDIRYFMLAGCVAALYYEDARNRSLGYDADSIMKCAEYLEINALLVETKEGCENLLREMCDMNILINAAGRYRFRQSRFLNVVGKNIGDIIDQIARVGKGI